MTENNHYYTPRCDLKDPCNELANVILLWQTTWLCKAMRSSTGYATVLQLKQESKTRSCSAWHTSNVLTKYINRWVNTCYVPPNLLNFTCLAVCNGLQVQHQALLSHAPLNLPDLTHDLSAFTQIILWIGWMMIWRLKCSYITDLKQKQSDRHFLFGINNHIVYTCGYSWWGKHIN